MEDLESKCYDKFDFKLENLQILIAKAGNSGFSYTSKVYKSCVSIALNYVDLLKHLHLFFQVGKPG